MCHRAPMLLLSLMPLLGALGCTVESGPPILDEAAITQAASTDSVGLSGSMAIAPGEGRIFLANLSRPGFANQVVAEDGSFSIEVDHQPGDAFRLQAIGNNSLLSLPIDFRLDAEGTRLPLDITALNCLDRFIESGQLLVTNLCDDTLELVVRASDPTTDLEQPTASLEPGQRTAVGFVQSSRPTVLSIEAADAVLAITIR